MPSIDPTLIISGDESVALSLHGRNLEIFHVATGETELIELPNPGKLIAVDGDAFALIGYARGSPVTIRTYRQPQQIIASAEVRGYTLTATEGGEHFDRLPPLLLVGVDSALLRRDGTFRMRRLRSALPDWVTDAEALTYAATCPDGRHVLICGYKYDGALLLWDAGTGRMDAQMKLLTQGVMAGSFRPGRAELWIGQIDTLERIDTREWRIMAAKRVRNQPTGSFVEALAFDADGRRLAVAHALRQPQGPPGTEWPWYAPSGGRLLVLDADRFLVTHTLAVDRWLDGLAWLSDGRIVAREWASNGAFRILSPEPGDHALHEPRKPGDWNWI